VAVTTPKPKHVIRGAFRYTLRAFITMSNRLLALNERRPDLNIMDDITVDSLTATVTAMGAKLEEKTPTE